MKKKEEGIKLCSVVTIGQKGQIVIPKEVRETVGLKPGNSLTVLLKDEKYIGLVRNDDLNNLMEYVNLGI